MKRLELLSPGVAGRYVLAMETGLRALICLLSLFVLFGCSGSAKDQIIGVENPREPSSSVPGVRSHDLFVLTSRSQASDPALMYSGDRARTLGFARVTVTIPPTHEIGRIERPRRSVPDPRRESTVIDPRVYATDSAFLADLNRALRERPASDRTILAFVHGYNTSYADAVLRMGQFVEDTGFRGVPVLFSWASAGKFLDYVYDINSALAARNDLIAASRILVRSNATSIDLLAHSMGNFLTVEAMRQAQVEGTYNRSGKLKTIILASADIDMDVFRDQMSVFNPDDRKFYVLISADDKALATSRFLAHGVNRVGDADAEELAKLGVTVIDMTAVQDPNNLNHGKFSESPAMVQMIGQALASGNSIDAASGGNEPITGAVRWMANSAYSVFNGGGSYTVVPTE